jgi:hypothetical protein
MEKESIIESTYQLSVEGIKEKWLSNPNLNWYNYIVSLPVKLRTVYVISILSQQVVNGGFHQYFINRYGQFIYETIESFGRINFKQIEELLIKVENVVNPENCSELEFISKIAKSELDALYDDEMLEEELENYDDLYYDFIEEIEGKLTDYLKEDASS